VALFGRTSNNATILDADVYFGLCLIISDSRDCLQVTNPGVRWG
jgi:hypothetical protein